MKFLSYYLPQFYPTPENDKYWGKNFTDWVNVKKAKPLFNGHKQPLLPADDVFYDLSDVKVLAKHSELSIENGVDGFGYWHYWFDNGYKTLEKVQEMHLANKNIKQNFFFAWANTDWTKSWVGDDSTTIFKQKYSKESAIKHFEYLEQFILDDRYLKINGKPMFQVINPHVMGAKEHILEIENSAIDSLGHGFHWVFPVNKNIEGLQSLTFSIAGFPPGDVTVNNLSFRIKRNLQKRKLYKGPVVIPQSAYIKSFKKTQISSYEENNSYIPCVLTGWDNTPRYKEKGFLIDGDISSLLRKQLNLLLGLNRELPKIVLVKAWNEWAEGNVVESYTFNGKIDFPGKVLKEVKEEIVFKNKINFK